MESPAKQPEQLTDAQKSELLRLCERLAFLTGTSLPPRMEKLEDIFRSMALSIEVCGKRIMRGRENKHRLKEVTEELERIDALKNQVVRRVSHELRAPLASIDGFAKALMHEAAGGEIPAERRKEFLRIITTEAGRLEEMIESIIELSSLESGEKNAPEMFTATEVFAAATMGLDYDKRNSKIVWQLNPAPSGPTLRADKIAITEALRQLLVNAQKFSAGQEVTAGAEYVSISPEHLNEQSIQTSCVRFFVQDKGVGIPPEDLPRVFDKFYRSEATASAFSGVGLGLSIVRALVNQNNGHVWAESEVGRGSTFFILLPAAL